MLELKCLLAPGVVLIFPFLIIKLGLELNANISETLILIPISFSSSPRSELCMLWDIKNVKRKAKKLSSCFLFSTFTMKGHREFKTIYLINIA